MKLISHMTWEKPISYRVGVGSFYAEQLSSYAQFLCIYVEKWLFFYRHVRVEMWINMESMGYCERKLKMLNVTGGPFYVLMCMYIDLYIYEV